MIVLPRSAGRMLADAPLTPSREEGRRWAEQELSGPEYHDRHLLARIADWISRHLPHPGSAGGGDEPLWWTVTKVLVVLGLVVLVIAVLGRGSTVLRRRVTAGGAAAVQDDEAVTAHGHRLAADAAAAQGHWDVAIVERFRAVAKELQERRLVSPVPGLTADEVAAEAGLVLPDLAAALARAARRFDDVRYGEDQATAADDEQLRDLDARVLTARRGAAAAPPVGALVVPR